MPRIMPQKLKTFARDEEGSSVVEMCFYLPMLVFIFVAMFTYFDLFRQQTVNLKAAYTISDLISRETEEINDTYIDSMYNLHDLLTRVDTTIALRVSVVRWDDDDQRYYVDWSVQRGDTLTPWTDSSISDVKDNLPTMPDQERIILVETENMVNAAFDLGALPGLHDSLGIQNVSSFVFTRPRFASQVVYVSGYTSGSDHDDGGEEGID